MNRTLPLTLLVSCLAITGLVSESAAAAQFLLKWGSLGAGDGQFDEPSGIAIGPAGNIYVADRNNDRIQKFSSSGTFLLKWGASGSGIGQFSSPRDVAADDSGYVYVADYLNNRVQKFASDGSYVAQWGTTGTGDGEFLAPRGITVDPSGFIYVTEDGFASKRVQKFTSTGVFITKWGSNGSGNGEFSAPRGIAADSSGFIYVSDTLNDRIQKFTDTGTYVTQWGTTGTGNGQFDFPIGLAWRGNSLLVVDSNNHRIQEFDNNGNLLSEFGGHCEVSSGTDCTDPDGGGPMELGEGEFHFPRGSAVDPVGNIYVADTENHRVQKFGDPSQIGIPEDVLPNISPPSAFPNPTSSSTRVSFYLGSIARSTPSDYRVKACVYDLSGRLVRELLDKELPAGAHSIAWDGRNEVGDPAPHGVFLLGLTVNGAEYRSVKIVRVP
jgi:DNA-binding beta-propeller fold protein YncE